VEYGGMVEVRMVEEPTHLGPHGMRRGRCQMGGSLETDTNKFEVLDTLSHCIERVDGTTGNSQVRWRFVRSHDKPKTNGSG